MRVNEIYQYAQVRFAVQSRHRFILGDFDSFDSDVNVGL